jgi:X-Pro dipeptidyl-peptidase (S15 family)
MTDMREIVVERDMMVPARDGVLLATDVYRPAGPGPYPVLLERTPYDQSAVSRFTVGPLRARLEGRAKLGVRFVMSSPGSASAVDQIACGHRNGQRPPTRSTSRFDAEIHMWTSVSALAELMVRIHSPPAESLQTFGSSRAQQDRARACAQGAVKTQLC